VATSNPDVCLWIAGRPGEEKCPISGCEMGVARALLCDQPGWQRGRNSPEQLAQDKSPAYDRHFSIWLRA